MSVFKSVTFKNEKYKSVIKLVKKRKTNFNKLVNDLIDRELNTIGGEHNDSKTEQAGKVETA